MGACTFFISRNIFLCLFMIRCLSGNIIDFFHGIIPSVLFKCPWYLTMLLFLSFYYRLKKSTWILIDVKKKGKKTPTSPIPKTTAKHQNTDQAICQKSKIWLFCGTIFFTDVCDITIKHKSIFYQSKWHHKPSKAFHTVKNSYFCWNGLFAPLGSLCSSFLLLAFIIFCANQKAPGKHFHFFPHQVPS